MAMIRRSGSSFPRPAAMIDSGTGRMWRAARSGHARTQVTLELGMRAEHMLGQAEIDGAGLLRLEAATSPRGHRPSSKLLSCSSNHTGHLRGLLRQYRVVAVEDTSHGSAQFG